MALQNRRGISRRRPQGSNIRGTEVPVERTRTSGSVAATLLPSLATLQEVRAIGGAVSRLWRDLAVSSNVPTSDHEEHSYQVGIFSWRIARLMGLSEERAERIFRAAYLHDVGSVSVPGPIMLKPGSLTAKQRKTMQVHPLISCQLLNAFLSTKDLAKIALSHHERFDGDGYPFGLQGAKIPLEARVLAIADSLDAMMSWRPYRDPLPFPLALEEVKHGAGRQFDANIVEVLARQGGSIAWSPSAPVVST